VDFTLNVGVRNKKIKLIGIDVQAIIIVFVLTLFRYIEVLTDRSTIIIVMISCCNRNLKKYNYNTFGPVENKSIFNEPCATILLTLLRQSGKCNFVHGAIFPRLFQTRF